ncbi:MAG: flagellar protein FlgN [Candidatus Riflebacteria bacterium]|nr:flagellar protein FlgN [Candidatus Riflebacteria bacterium]
MQDSFTRIQEILEKEFAIYGELFSLSERKHKILLEKFSTELNKIVAEEEGFVVQLIPFEEERRSIIANLTGNPDSPVEKIFDYNCPPENQLKIKKVSQELKSLLFRIKEINEGNQRLLEQALELTKHSLKLLTTPPKEIVYKFPGAKKSQALVRSRLIDKKA